MHARDRIWVTNSHGYIDVATTSIKKNLRRCKHEAGGDAQSDRGNNTLSCKKKKQSTDDWIVSENHRLGHSLPVCCRVHVKVYVL